MPFETSRSLMKFFEVLKSAVSSLVTIYCRLRTFSSKVKGEKQLMKSLITKKSNRQINIINVYDLLTMIINPMFDCFFFVGIYLFTKYILFPKSYLAKIISVCCFLITFHFYDIFRSIRKMFSMCFVRKTKRKTICIYDNFHIWISWKIFKYQSNFVSLCYNLEKPDRQEVIIYYL
jgi:hypothetical protein